MSKLNDLKPLKAQEVAQGKSGQFVYLTDSNAVRNQFEELVYITNDGIYPAKAVELHDGLLVARFTTLSQQELATGNYMESFTELEGGLLLPMREEIYRRNVTNYLKNET